MRIAMLVLLLVGFAGAAAAQDRFGETDSRYEFNRVDGGLQVGIAAELVPLCAWRAGGWACAAEQESRAPQTRPDNRSGREIARLQNEVAALKRQLADAGESPNVAPFPAPAPRPEPGDGVTVTPARHGFITRVSDCLAYTWRRVVDMIVGVFG